MVKKRKKQTYAQLQDENDFLRAMMGRCIACGRTRDDATLVEYEVWLDREGKGYSSCAWFGGGAGGVGKTEREAIEHARKHMIKAITSDGKKAAKQPWRRVDRERRWRVNQFAAQEIVSAILDEIQGQATRLVQIATAKSKGSAKALRP